MGLETRKVPPIADGEVVATIVEALPNTLFKVRLPDGSDVLAYLSGKMRMHRIRIFVGDTIRVLPDPYGSRARITRRL